MDRNLLGRIEKNAQSQLINSYAAARPDSLLVSGVGVQQRNVTRVVTCYSSSNGMFMYKIIHYPLFGHINYMSHVVVSPLCLG